MPNEKELTEDLKKLSVSDIDSSKTDVKPDENKSGSKTTDPGKMDATKILELLKKQEKEGKKSHRFWSTQPVPQSSESSKVRKEELMQSAETKVSPLDQPKSVEEVRKDPYNLPKGFHWDVVDVDDESELKEAYELLTNHYVEDDDNMFRFDYSKEFLKWALRPPGFVKDWILGVRQTSNGALLALITGIPAKVHVFETSREMAEINFLCVHKKLRAKRLAPVLIKEVTRRVNLTGRWQAVYTAGVVIPTPVAKCRYYHRSINPPKLVAVGFSGLGTNMTMKRLVRLNKLPEETNLEGLRKMEQKDVPQVTKLLKKYLNKFKTWIEWNQDEVSHWLLERPGVVNSYVVAKPDGKVTDFCSFYHIPSTVIGHERYNSMLACYSFYNVATSTSLTNLMNNALVLARDLGCDVFNCLDLMDNAEFIDELKFGKGDGFLNYYLFNLRTPAIQSKEVGIVLL